MATKKKGNKGRRPPSRPSSKSPKPPSKSQAKASPATKTAPPAKAAPAAKAPAGKKPAEAKAGRTTPAKAKPERAGSTRAERIEAAQRARRRKALLTRVAVVGTVLVLAFVAAFFVVSKRNEKSESIAKLETGSCQYDERSDRDSGPGRNHIGGQLAYDVNPPSGGNHNPQATPPGQYTVEQLPPDAQLVHALEHGYIILWYKPDLPQEGIDQLKTLTDKYPKDVLLVPRPSMDQPVAASAWHRRLLCGAAEPAALEAFVTDYRNKGPEKVPHE